MPVTEEDLARFSADRKPEEKMETAVEREEKAAARRDQEERRAALGTLPMPVPVQEGKGRAASGSGRCIPREYHHGRKGPGKGDSSL